MGDSGGGGGENDRRHRQPSRSVPYEVLARSVSELLKLIILEGIP
jgi:hypothetical protein